MENKKPWLSYDKISNLSDAFSYIKDIGFDLIYHYIGKGDLAWLEFRKPGQITSLRGGQTLAQIVRK